LELYYKQWIGSSRKGFGPLKYLVRDLIPDSCVWENNRLKGYNPFCVPLIFFDED